DDGRFPAKRVVGEEIVVEADLLRDGHERIAAALRYRYEDEDWQETPFAPRENDRWQASFRPDRIGNWRYTIEAWTDRFGSWCEDFGKKRAAGQDVSLELLEGEWFVRAALRHTLVADVPRLRAILDEYAAADPAAQAELLLSDELNAVMVRNDER